MSRLGSVLLSLLFLGVVLDAGIGVGAGVGVGVSALEIPNPVYVKEIRALLHSFVGSPCSVGTVSGNFRCSANSPCATNVGVFDTGEGVFSFWMTCDHNCDFSNNVTVKTFSDIECKNPYNLFRPNTNNQTFYIGGDYSFIDPTGGAGSLCFTADCVSSINAGSRVGTPAAVLVGTLLAALLAFHHKIRPH
jgi:hypothetical protein